MITRISKFISGTHGASLMEYGLLLMLVCLVCVAATNLLQMVITNLFTPLTFK